MNSVLKKGLMEICFGRSTANQVDVGSLPHYSHWVLYFAGISDIFHQRQISGPSMHHGLKCC